MDTEMTRYESFAEVTEDFYCSAVDVLKLQLYQSYPVSAQNYYHILRQCKSSRYQKLFYR